MPGPAIRVTFFADTPAMFQRALARPFIAADVSVDYVAAPPRATRSVGQDVGLILVFLAGAAVEGVTFEAEKQLFQRAVRALRAILSEAPFRAEIQVRDQVVVTEYLLPSGEETGPALDGYLADLAAGRWRGGRLRWSSGEGWVQAEPEPVSEGTDADVSIFGSLAEAQQAAWIEEQLQKRRDYEAQVAWVIRTLDKGWCRVAQ